jgi:hypothetical protein
MATERRQGIGRGSRGPRRGRKHSDAPRHRPRRCCAGGGEAITDAKPEALRLAEFFEFFKSSSHLWTNGESVHLVAAAELRRLHAINMQLLEALDAMESEKADYMRLNRLGDPAEEYTNKKARAAINAAKEGT